MIATELISGITVPPGPWRCACCRRAVETITPLRQVVSDNFLNYDLLDCQADGLCPACTECFRCRALRMHSFVATPAGRRLLRRAEVRPVLLEPPDPPFVLCVTYTMKKHNAFRARVALHRAQFPVRVEDQLIWVDRAVAQEQATLLDEALGHWKLPRTAVCAGRWTQTHIRRLGLARWRVLEAALARHRGTPLFALLAWSTVISTTHPEESHESE